MIENEFYEDEFELLLKEKADQFSMYPSKRVWHSIYNNLHPGRRWPSVVISLVLISSLMLIGYLNTGENSITSQINSNPASNDLKGNQITTKQNTDQKKQDISAALPKQKAVQVYDNAFDDVITHETDFYTYTVVKSNRPLYVHDQAATADINSSTQTILPGGKQALSNIVDGQEIVQSLDAYIKSGKIFSDVAANNSKYKTEVAQTTDKKSASGIGSTNSTSGVNLPAVENTGATIVPADNSAMADADKLLQNNKKTTADLTKTTDKKITTDAEKAWIESYALQNKPTSKKWKGRLGYQFYVTPAVNYRKLTTKTKYSATPFAEGDINKSISQKPGVGIEAGFGLNYAVAKKLQFKGSVQFNYTSYNIAADQTNHPVATDILLNDPASGLSYSSARTTTISNGYNASAALTPVTLHNRTYQISIPLGLAYKISSKNNVDWFAGTSIQPSYVFGGNAHIISSDLKKYVSEPSSIRSWNLNLGFETYMNFKMGTYNLQVGPQVRYQVQSTYKSNVALIEKPYAVGIKFGLTKGF
jgi:hypothetical protein